MVAAVVLPYWWMFFTTFSSGRPSRSLAASMMRMLAWWATKRSTSLGREAVPLEQVGSLISANLRTAYLKTCWPSWRT